MVLTLYMVVLVVFRAQTICFCMWNFQHRQPEAAMVYYSDTNQTIIISTSDTSYSKYGIINQNNVQCKNYADISLLWSNVSETPSTYRHMDID